MAPIWPGKTLSLLTRRRRESCTRRRRRGHLRRVNKEKSLLLSPHKRKGIWENKTAASRENRERERKGAHY